MTPSKPTRRLAIGAITAFLAAGAAIATVAPASAAGQGGVTLGATSGAAADFGGAKVPVNAIDLDCGSDDTAWVRPFLALPGSERPLVTDPSVYPFKLDGIVAADIGSGVITGPTTDGKPDPYFWNNPDAVKALLSSNAYYNVEFSQQTIGGWLQVEGQAGVDTLSLGFMCVSSGGQILTGADNRALTSWTTLSFDAAGAWHVVVQKADTTTTLAATASGAYGASLTATIAAGGSTAAAATGTVDFFEGADKVGSAAVAGGVATLGLTGLSVGDHSYTAVYTPAADAAFNGSTAPAATVTITAVKSDTKVGLDVKAKGADSADLTATVTAGGATAAAATGAVDFYADGGKIGSGTLDAGVATYTATGLKDGAKHTFSAKYAGDSAFNASESSTVTVALPAKPTPLKDGDVVTPGAAYTVSLPAGSFDASSTVTGEIHSDPIRLTETAPATADGAADYTFTAPANLPSGAHQLVLTGGSKTVTIAFSVAAAVDPTTPAGPGTTPAAGGANNPVSFATDWIGTAASTPGGLIALIAAALAALSAATAGVAVLIRRRFAPRIR